MPQSGQTWDPSLFSNSSLLLAFAPYLASWREKPSFPDACDYTALAEGERLARAPELAPLSFQLTAKKARREKRQHIELGELYDGSIALHQRVPVLNDSYHDLLNALMFAVFPRSKRRLHERQFEALKHWIPAGASRLPGQRTREQDALTIFDEGGSVVLLDPTEHARWLEAVTPTRIPTFDPPSGALPLLFGHALLEHSLRGFPSLRSSAVVLPAPTHAPLAEVLDRADRALLQRLSDPGQFAEPGADAVLEMTPAGELWLGPRKPSWREFHRQADGTLTTKLHQPRQR